MYKIIAADLDGTLLNDKKQVSKADIKTIEYLKDNGIYLILSSGRYYKGILNIAKELNLDNCYHVGDNGNSYFSTDGKTHFIKYFDENDYKKLVFHLRKTCKSFVVTNKDGMWYETEDESCVVTMLPNNGDPNFRKVSDVLLIDKPFKICAYFEKDEEKDEILSKSYDTINGCVSYHVLIDFYPKGIDKHVTLLKVANMLGVKEEEMIAVGDSDNDIPLIEGKNLGISVLNGSESLKEKANIILPVSNNENPMSYICKKYIKLSQN